MNWIKQDGWGLCLVLMMGPAMIWSIYHWSQAAHAQEKPPQFTAIGDAFPRPLLIMKPDHSWVVGPEMWNQIEQHCVAIGRAAKDIKHPADGDGEDLSYMIPQPHPDLTEIHRKPWVEHIPEQTLKLRCK